MNLNFLSRVIHKCFARFTGIYSNYEVFHGAYPSSHISDPYNFNKPVNTDPGIWYFRVSIWITTVFSCTDSPTGWLAYPNKSGAPLQTRINLFPAWISKYIHYKMYDEITSPFPNFNSATVEVWEWKSNFITHLTGHMVTYSCWNSM